MTTYTNLAPMVWAGDYIEFKGDKYEVIKVMRVNIRIKQLDTGMIYNLPLRANFTKIERPADAPPKKPYREMANEREDRFAKFVTGTVVRRVEGRPVHSKWTYKPGQLFIVMKHNFELVNIVKLGGDAGRYWRLSPEELEVVPVPES